MKLKHILIALAGVAPLGACGSTPTAQRYDALLAGRPGRVEVEIHESVAKACHLADAKAYFDYASDGLDDEAKAKVYAIADCLRRGPLAGQSVVVTGYTDKTGPSRFNRELGMWRGESVAEELYAAGVSPRRIYLRTRGEAAAKGKDPLAMQHDRRVEVRLVERE